MSVTDIMQLSNNNDILHISIPSRGHNFMFISYLCLELLDLINKV